ncbi:Anaphase-promoting complex subunit 6 [Camellia lanceoleosa]|uniref:Anaphase-promoting complex subunit 6 n=1 Tax=Camellia lanceoleosa TaxID=1840588 RepID=A0ACC0GKL2_9ERIC|nr:Anaphase-promoting complex subunit 6 [Camellia lanceoleosa]
MEKYKKAVWWFEKTLAHIPSLSGMWEPTVINLPMQLIYVEVPEAITYYEKALALSTVSLSTYVGLAYTYHLRDNFTTAITYYHKALWLKPDDQFCTEMLTLALADECRHGIDPKTESLRNDVFI